MKENRFLVLFFGSIMVGTVDGLIFPFLIKLFSLDKELDIWELIITVLIMIVILFGFIRFCLKFIKFKFLLFLIPSGILTMIFDAGTIIWRDRKWTYMAISFIRNGGFFILEYSFVFMAFDSKINKKILVNSLR